MIEHIRLPRETFREISMSATGPTGLAVLDAIHLNRQYLLVRMVVDRLPPGARSGGMVRDSLALLTHVQREDRVAFDAILTYPHVGSGLVRCLRELVTNGDVRFVGRRLATIAGAAAFRAGVDFDLGVSANAASVHLPATGTAYIGESVPEIRLRQRRGHRTIGPMALPPQDIDESMEWSRVRRLDCSAIVHADTDIRLDDVDPDRGAGGLFPAGRLSPAEFAVWKEMFALACQRLAAVHPDWAGQIGRVIRAITPLVRQRPNQGRSATTWQAYGAVALTLPTDELALAAVLVHELQHSKMNALITAVDLFDPADTSRHYSPWRADPRPLRGLLHGCYAFLGVAAFWSAECAAGAGSRADYEFARSALQVRQALDALANVTALTQLGREFVRCLAEWLDRLPAKDLPDPIRHLAELAVDDHRVLWRLRTVVPDSVTISAIAAAWREGRPISSLPVGAELERSVETFVHNDRHQLWSRLAGQPVPDSNDPDILLARQAPGSAAKLYLDAVREEPASMAAWSGLAMAAARGNGADRLLWTYRPELIRAVYEALRNQNGEPPDPLALAEWLAKG